MKREPKQLQLTFAEDKEARRLRRRDTGRILLTPLVLGVALLVLSHLSSWVNANFEALVYGTLFLGFAINFGIVIPWNKRLESNRQSTAITA